VSSKLSSYTTAGSKVAQLFSKLFRTSSEAKTPLRVLKNVDVLKDVDTGLDTIKAAAKLKGIMREIAESHRIARTAGKAEVFSPVVKGKAVSILTKDFSAGPEFIARSQTAREIFTKLWTNRAYVGGGVFGFIFPPQFVIAMYMTTYFSAFANRLVSPRFMAASGGAAILKGLMLYFANIKEDIVVNNTSRPFAEFMKEMMFHQSKMIDESMNNAVNSINRLNSQQSGNASGGVSVNPSPLQRETMDAIFSSANSILASRDMAIVQQTPIVNLETYAAALAGSVVKDPRIAQDLFASLFANIAIDPMTKPFEIQLIGDMFMGSLALNSQMLGTIDYLDQQYPSSDEFTHGVLADERDIVMMQGATWEAALAVLEPDQINTDSGIAVLSAFNGYDESFIESISPITFDLDMAALNRFPVDERYVAEQRQKIADIVALYPSQAYMEADIEVIVTVQANLMNGTLQQFVDAINNRGR